MKDINILGIAVKDGSVRELLNVTDGFLLEGAVRTIVYLTGSVLSEAQKREEQRRYIEEADLTLWGDLASLKAAGIMANNKYREMDGREYLVELLHKMARSHRAVLVLSDTQEHADLLKQELQELQSSVSCVGTFPLNTDEKAREKTINDINLLAPSLVIVRMPLWEQLAWLKESRTLLNTNVWLAMPEHFDCVWERPGFGGKVAGWLKNSSLWRRINRYTK